MTPRRLQRTVTATVAVALVLLAGVTRPAAAQSIPVTVGGRASSLTGATFDIPIVIDMGARAERLGSFRIEIGWNPAVLELASGRDGDFGPISVNDDSLAAGRFVASGANAAGVGGRITIATARFKPLADDTTTLVVTVSELYAAGSFDDLTSFAAPANKPYCPAFGRYGDVDGDGAANSRDALVVLSASIGIDVSGFSVGLGDVDANGQTEARDALIILSYTVGLDVSQFPVFTIAPGACALGGRPALVVTPGLVTVSPGQEIIFSATATDTTGAVVAVADLFWSSSDDAVVAVGPSGVATAVANGTAVIQAVQAGGDTATATVTVTDQRHVYWVDALAANAQNQLGDSAFPFGLIQEAVYFAGEGDTVRVRPGTYRQSVAIDRSVVLEGDTSMGGLRPFLGYADDWYPAIAVGAANRVEIHNFRVDTMYQPVVAYATDTLLIRNTEFRMPASGFAAVSADTVGLLRIERSRFYGATTSEYGTNAVYVENAGTVSMDSSVVADFGGDGLVLVDVDSLDLRDNVIRHNLGYGVYVCNACYSADTTRGVAAVFRGNRFRGSEYGQVWLGYYRSAQFERNLFVGAGPYYYYDAVELIGHGGSVASFLADSFDVQDGPWIGAEGYDSLSVDSAVVVQRGDWGWLDNGRRTVIRNTQFLELDYGALYVYGWNASDPMLVLQNVAFLGPDSTNCAHCGDAVEADYVTVIADSITGHNLYGVFWLYEADLTLTNSQLTDQEFVVDASCSSVALSDVAAVDGYYGIYNSGCGTGEDSVTVEATQFQSFYYGVESYSSRARVEGSSFLDVNYPIYSDCGSLTARLDTLSNGSYGIEAYGCWGTTGYEETLTVDSLWVEQFLYSGVYASGWDTAAVVRSTFVNMPDGIVLYDGRLTAADNVLSGITSDGVRVDSDTYGSVFVERNQIGCTTGSEGIQAWSYEPDSTFVRDNVVSGCLSGIYAYAADHTEVAGNDITMPATRQGNNGIEARSVATLRVTGNTVSGVARYGSIDANYSRHAEVDSNAVTGSAEAGLYVIYVDSLLAYDNTFVAHDTASCCLSEYPGAIVLSSTYTANAGSAVLRGNRVTGSATSGIVLYRNSGDTVTAVVDSNSVKGATASGVYLTGYGRALLTRNAIDSTGMDAVYVDRWAGADSAAVVLANNNFTRSGRYGVYNVDGTLARYDATNNWWNDVNGPSGLYGDTTFTSVGDSVSANLRWDPWRTTPQPDAPTPAPPAFLVASAVEPLLVTPLRAPGELPDGTRRTLPVREARTFDLAPRLPRFIPPEPPAALERLLAVERDATAVRADRLAVREGLEAARAERTQARAAERLRQEEEAEARRRAGVEPPRGERRQQ